MALYLPEHNVLFLHTPKTGGTFVRRVLKRQLDVKTREVGFKHCHKDLVGPLRFREKPFTFTFVRHPVTWYRSYWLNKIRRPVDGSHWYYWQPKTLWHPNWEIDPHLGSDDFPTWIRNVSNRGDYLLDMYRWYTGRGTRDEIDFIGKTETLLDDLFSVFDRHGIEYDATGIKEMGLVNAKKPHQKEQANYTDELLSLVIDSERKCIETYGYDDMPPPR
jgi:hypothetical protein